MSTQPASRLPRSTRRTPALLWLLAVGAATAATAMSAVGCDNDPAIAAHRVPVRVLTWNIGHPNAMDPDYPLRLSHQDYEDHVGARIRELAPDVVMLQEVLPETHCATVMETDPAMTCYGSGEREPPIRRILGPDYTIACDGRLHVECIAVRVGFGQVVGLDPGAYSIDFAETPPLPLPACVWAEGSCNNDLCDFESTVSAVTARTPWGDLRLVHLHPNAAGSGDLGVYNGAPCRALQLQQVFQGLAEPVPDPENGNIPGTQALVSHDRPTLLAGDFNFDPVRMASQSEKELWATHVGPEARFMDHNPVGPDGLQYGTRRGALGAAIDRVLADRELSSGQCVVFGWDEGFGEDPGTLPLDEDFDWSLVPDGIYYENRIDHFAILCDLVMDLR